MSDKSFHQMFSLATSFTEKMSNDNYCQSNCGKIYENYAVKMNIKKSVRTLTRTSSS